MRDGLIRRGVKAVAVLCFRIDAAGSRLVRKCRGERPYVLAGECKCCGACCINPGIQPGRLAWFFPTVRRLFLLWHKHVNGFELVERDPVNRMFVFRCTHYDPATHQCDSYSSRPGMCREYPRLLLWVARPEFLPGCGHYPVAPGARGFVEALEREDLPPEKLEEIKRKLYLQE